ncbi:hypothetical protein TrST_g10968 [Triparma strigata]|uniref:Uncharacterized protein n=1 Tax=Triparma strigata TaxID=1606541 RepID=A0A9W7C699_9STRA|nr:hypothetical protein TrST_g10968 [Triparma strigata]
MPRSSLPSTLFTNVVAVTLLSYYWSWIVESIGAFWKAVLVAFFVLVTVNTDVSLSAQPEAPHDHDSD